MTLVVNHVLYFILYSFGGWVCECIYCSIPAKKFINRGFLTGPYCPIYGCGALLITWFLAPYVNQPILIFILGLLMTSVLEYMTSWIMELLFHTKWWDYSNRFCNINARVCFKNSILFGLMSLVVMYVIHPVTRDIINDFPVWTANAITLIFLFGFGYDLYHTVRSLLQRNRTFIELEAALQELKQCFEETQSIPGESFKEHIQYVLDHTEADEKIALILQNIKEKLELPKKYASVREHLKKAYPNQRLSSSKKTIEAYIHALQNRNNPKL